MTVLTTAGFRNPKGFNKTSQIIVEFKKKQIKNLNIKINLSNYLLVIFWCRKNNKYVKKAKFSGFIKIFMTGAGWGLYSTLTVTALTSIFSPRFIAAELAILFSWLDIYGFVTTKNVVFSRCCETFYLDFETKSSLSSLESLEFGVVL